MSGENGHFVAAVIDQRDWDDLQGKVETHDELFPQLGALMREIGQARMASTRAEAAAERAANHALQLDATVKDLLSWRDDSKVTRIADLVGQVSFLEREKAEAAKEAERDRLDRRRSARAAALTFLVTVAAAIVVDWIKRGGH